MIECISPGVMRFDVITCRTAPKRARHYGNGGVVQILKKIIRRVLGQLLHVAWHQLIERLIQSLFSTSEKRIPWASFQKERGYKLARMGPKCNCGPRAGTILDIVVSPVPRVFMSHKGCPANKYCMGH